MIVWVGRGGSMSSSTILEEPVGSCVIAGCYVSSSAILEEPASSCVTAGCYVLITTGEGYELAPVIRTWTILYPA